MPESILHRNLVLGIRNWIALKYFSGDIGPVFVDLPEHRPKAIPPKLIDFMPDVFVYESNGIGPIVGEAKTYKDLETRHSIQQFNSFLTWCNVYDNATFILSVPWDLDRAAKWLLEDLKNKIGASKVNLVVINEVSCHSLGTIYAAD